MVRGCLVLLVLAVVIIGVHSQSDSLGKSAISSIYICVTFAYFVSVFSLLYNFFSGAVSYLVQNHYYKHETIHPKKLLIV